jgi:DNA-directed RNA polymerase specialized sigma24 family protein
MKNFKDNVSANKTNEFEKRVLSITHLLHPYVKQRLRVAENMGILPKNMFQSNEIIDEVILQIYEKENHIEIEAKELRILMFEGVNTKLMHLFEDEKWHKKTISTKFVLEEELKQLEENFTIDADNDYIMKEELDDISYHQNNHENAFLPYDSAEENVLSFLEIKDNAYLKNQSNRLTIRGMYQKLPLQTSNVVDLYLLGKLNIQEIAIILAIEIVEVKRIIEFVKENFKKRIN